MRKVRHRGVSQGTPRPQVELAGFQHRPRPSRLLWPSPLSGLGQLPGSKVWSMREFTWRPTHSPRVCGSPGWRRLSEPWGCSLGNPPGVSLASTWSLSCQGTPAGLGWEGLSHPPFLSPHAEVPDGTTGWCAGSWGGHSKPWDSFPHSLP